MLPESEAPVPPVERELFLLSSFTVSPRTSSPGPGWRPSGHQSPCAGDRKRPLAWAAWLSLNQPLHPSPGWEWGQGGSPQESWEEEQKEGWSLSRQKQQLPPAAQGILRGEETLPPSRSFFL